MSKITRVELHNRKMNKVASFLFMVHPVVKKLTVKTLPPSKVETKE